MKLLPVAFLLLLLCAAIEARSHHAFVKQSKSGKTDSKRENSITGRLITESGQPIANAVIDVVQTGRSGAPSRSTTTDDEGRFRASELSKGVYRLFPETPGYVTVNRNPEELRYRPGDNANIIMTKGGVITGTITNMAGEPMIAMSVQSIMVKDKNGRAVSSIRDPKVSSITDDRGVYRLYGLNSGTYLILASGHNDFSDEPAPYENDVPTYHPSSTRDTAVPVTLRTGEEITGIDVRYRGEAGHAISGSVKVAPANDSPETNINLYLINIPSLIRSATAFSRQNQGAHSFDIYGVPDGEYYLMAQLFDDGGNRIVATNRVRVKVKGADVTGLEIPLLSLGSIGGNVRIEPARETTGCKARERISPDETLVNARRDEKEEKNETPLFLWETWQAVPTDTGEFTINSVEVGHYRIEHKLIGEYWYIRSITLPSPVPSKPAIDIARNGFAVKQGERIAGLTITLAEGAAAVKGKLVSATENARLPDRLRVHLVPAEKESVNDVLRFAEAAVESDGSFSMSNLTPGRYLIIARPVTGDDSQPVAWSSADRAALRQAAEAANLALELQPCQRVTDYALRYKNQ